VALSAFAMPVGLERRLRLMKGQIDSTAHRPNVGLAFTEWLFHGPNNRVSTFNNMGGAICAAGMLSTFIRTSDFLTVADMTGLVEFGGMWKKREQVYGVPAYYAFRMYSRADATVPVAVDNQTETYDIANGNTRVPDIPRVAYLDVVAALNDAGDRLTLFCINRDPHKDRTAKIELAGFQAEATARVETLTAANISAENDEEHPLAVKPVESVVSLGPSYSFPKLSVTVMELRRQH
jgi:alpha-N-arabinofuranosidase